MSGTDSGSAASIWGTWHIETAWGWRDGEDSPEMLVAWDCYSYEQNEQGFREAVAMAFADNQMRTETLRRVTLKVNGDRIMELYETPEIEAEAEASE